MKKIRNPPTPIPIASFKVCVCVRLRHTDAVLISQVVAGGEFLSGRIIVGGEVEGG